MQINSIYLYPNKVDVYTTDANTWTGERFNMVYSRGLKMYRSVDNRVDFQLRNGQQKTFNATGTILVFNLVNNENEDLVLQKDCTYDDAAVGRAYVTITETELQSLEPGNYTWSLHKETRQSINDDEYRVTSSAPLYLDSQFGSSGVLEIIGDLQGSPYDTKVIDTFRKITNFDVPVVQPSDDSGYTSFPRPNFAQNINSTGYEEYFLSSTIDAQPNVTDPNSLHTFQFFYNDYEGTVLLQASLGEGANPIEGSWTDLQTFNITTANTNTYYNATGKYNWFRIKHTPAESNIGSLDKVLYR